jgi:hypothetical protein
MLLLPETVAHQDGRGPEIALDQRGTPMLLTLGITRIIEDECLDVTLWGSTDSKDWRQLAAFPQKFYCGDYSLAVDLSRNPDVRYLRAHWTMGCLAPGERKPLFGFHLSAERQLTRHAGAA